MANFFKEAMAELEHVVWPTHIETKRFFQIVVWVIVGVTLFTYGLTLIYSNAMFGIRDFVHRPTNADLSNSPVASGEAKPATSGEVAVPIKVNPKGDNVITLPANPQSKTITVPVAPSKK